jgi:hypothetical protein
MQKDRELSARRSFSIIPIPESPSPTRYARWFFFKLVTWGRTLVRGSAMFTPYLTGKHRPSGVLQMGPDARRPMSRGARTKREIPLPLL